MVLNLLGISWHMRGQEAVPRTRPSSGIYSYVHNGHAHVYILTWAHDFFVSLVDNRIMISK